MYHLRFSLPAACGVQSAAFCTCQEASLTQPPSVENNGHCPKIRSAPRDVVREVANIPLSHRARSALPSYALSRLELVAVMTARLREPGLALRTSQEELINEDLKPENHSRAHDSVSTLGGFIRDATGK